MWNIIKSTIILAIFAFAAAFALSHVNHITQPNIQKQLEEKQRNALLSVLPGFSITDEKKVIIEGKEFVYWTGEKDGSRVKSKGYAFITEKPGYGGPVTTMAGVDDKWQILGISILQQTETPGLGSRSTEIASSKTFLQVISGESSGVEESNVPWFQQQFAGLKADGRINIVKMGDWNAGMREKLLALNSISAITGATVTTRAVRDSIEEGISRLRKAIEMTGPEERK